MAHHSYKSSCWSQKLWAPCGEEDGSNEDDSDNDDNDEDDGDAE